MIKFDYTPTLIDFIKTFWTFFYQKKRNLLLPFFGIFNLLCFLIVAVNKQDIRLGTDSNLIPVLALLLMLFLIFGPFLLNLWPAYLVRRGGFNRVFHCEAGDEQVLFQSENKLEKWSWAVFSKKIETRKYFILLSDQTLGNFFFIPKRAFSSEEDKNIFKKFLETKILPKARKTSPLKDKLNFNNPAFDLNLFIRIILIIIMLILVLINVLIGFRNSEVANNLMFIVKDCLFL